ncbi:MAG TPA: recombinase family protein [Roseiarcus sp.]|nr:recombinase family protein [Roseiarcus sp.]
MVELRQNSSPARAKVRCAVYTRKSSEEGLEQEFNSLDAQREACEAYVTSQKHEGWTALATFYDDGAYSGGTMDRPALQRLLDDVRTGKIDVVVVYKVDRLTRSLADFAKIVEVFDAQGVSFVSVTQAFNTTTSMGRLTLNVLLSFAQFEREVTGERIRDKIAASKKKGMWMGGQPSLGYDVKERKLVVNEAEAATVRYIFWRYLELETVRALRDDLAAAGIVSKRRTAADGSTYGGQRLSRGALYLMLKNRIYRGEIVHKGKSFPGEHAAIVDEDLWRRVQSHLEENRMERREGDKALEPSLLAGIAFDARSEPMTPTHAVKKGTRYRYYISRRLITGPATATSQGQRVPASNLEALVIGRLRALLADPVEFLNAISNGERDSPMQMRLRNAAAALSARWGHLPIVTQQDLARSVLVRAQVDADRIDLDVGSARLVSWLLNQGADEGIVEGNRTSSANADGSEETLIRLSIRASLKRTGKEMKFIVEGVTNSAAADTTLIRLLVRGQKIAKRMFESNCPPLEAIAREERITGSYATRLVRLAFLAPDIVAAILAGKQPAGLTANKLMADTRLSLDWRDQRAALGFA